MSREMLLRVSAYNFVAFRQLASEKFYYLFLNNKEHVIRDVICPYLCENKNLDDLNPEEYYNEVLDIINSEAKSIELDTPPGPIRPSDLIKNVIAGTGLPLKEPVSKSFGNWKWVYPEVSFEHWKLIRPRLKERIEELYHSGVIRYGSF